MQKENRFDNLLKEISGIENSEHTKVVKEVLIAFVVIPAILSVVGRFLFPDIYDNDY